MMCECVEVRMWCEECDLLDDFEWRRRWRGTRSATRARRVWVWMLWCGFECLRVSFCGVRSVCCEVSVG